MSRLRSFLALPTPRKKLFVGALTLTVVVRTGFLLASFRRTAGFFERLPVARRGTTSRREIRWAVTAAGNQVPDTTCLARALVAHTLCRRYGHDSSLYVGVDRDSEEFAAHSWVESEGEVVVGDDVDLSRYETLGVVAS